MEGRIIFATGNENKLIEIRQILGDLGMEIVSQKEAGIFTDPDENGTSFEENALIKAQAVAAQCREIVLSDDSGLEVDYMNKEPGIYSARWGGRDTSYVIKNQMILDRLAGVPHEKRTARFVCAVAAVIPGREPIVVRETMEGYIGDRPAGENGFGYDPIFYLPDVNCSSAELSPEEKNARSHRGKAFRAMRRKLEELQ